MDLVRASFSKNRWFESEILPSLKSEITSILQE